MAEPQSTLLWSCWPLNSLAEDASRITQGFSVAPAFHLHSLHGFLAQAAHADILNSPLLRVFSSSCGTVTAPRRGEKQEAQCTWKVFSDQLLTSSSRDSCSDRKLTFHPLMYDCTVIAELFIFWYLCCCCIGNTYVMLRTECYVC